MMLFVQNRHTDQWDKMEDPNISTYNYGHLIFNKESKKRYPGGKRQHLQKMVLVKPNVHMQKN